MDSSSPIKTATSAQEMLQLFLAAEDERAPLLLESLLRDHAEPIIKDVIRRKMGVHLDYVRYLDRASANREAGFGTFKRAVELDAEDVHSTAVLSLVDHLSCLKANPGEEAIRDFRGYVGRVALSAFAQHLRQRYPQRHRLRRKLSYLTREQSAVSGFAQWQGQSPGEPLIGFRAWEGQPINRTRNYENWREDTSAFRENALAGRDPRRLPFPDLLAAILNWVGSPMDVDDLINGLAQLLELREVELVYV